MGPQEVTMTQSENVQELSLTDLISIDTDDYLIEFEPVRLDLVARAVEF